jgi:hypothetical protein
LPRDIEKIPQELEQLNRIEDPQQLYNKLTRLVSDVYMVLIELLQQVAAEPDYPLLRDIGLAALVPNLKQVATTIRSDPTPELVQALAAYLTALAEWAQGSCYPGLDTALAALEVPAIDADAAQWDTFIAELKRLSTYIDTVIGWELSDEQTKKVERYFQAVNLLEECLDVAYAANRDEIRASLLLPPGMWQPGSGEGNDWGL